VSARGALRAWLLRLDRRASALAFRRYASARLYTHARLRLSPMRAPILIYSVGKVGSSTVAEALAARGLGASLYHLHWLTPARLRRDAELQRAAAARHRGTPLEAHFRPRYVWRGEFLRERVQGPPPGGGSWRIVTLVRDPLARNVSAFFQNLPLLGYDVAARPGPRSEDEVDALLALFARTYLRPGGADAIDGDPLTWFDEELAAVFGTDVYAAPFPVERGFAIHEGARARVLVLRLEDLDRCAAAAFEAFLGLRGLALRREQGAEDKAYAALYRRFRERLRVPDDALERFYGSRYARHFYSDAERARFRARWAGA
jgi:hypothetical protein